jgi:hypothetical protein
MVMEEVGVEDGITVIVVRSAALRAICPACGGAAGRVHSRYIRTLSDLPLSGRAVRLKLSVRASGVIAQLASGAFSSSGSSRQIRTPDGQRAWTSSCTISAWRSAVVRLPPSRGG